MDGLIRAIYSFSFKVLGFTISSNDLAGTIINMLSTDTLFNSSNFTLYYYVSAINKAIVPVGESLLVLFFMINIAKMSQEGVERITWERIVLKAVVFFVLVYFIQHSLSWFTTLANVVENSIFQPLKNNLTIATGDNAILTDLPETLINMAKNAGGNWVTEQLYYVVFIILAIPYLATIVMVLAQVLLRAIKIMIYLMFSPIPIAFAAEGETYRGKAITFFLQFVGVCFEAVIIYIGTWAYAVGLSGISSSATGISMVIGILFMNGLLSALISASSQISERFFSRG